MRVSVLIVNYKAYDELSRCLASIAPFRSNDVEAIVADHATDPAAAARLAAEHRWIRMLASPENPGFSAGVNRAASVATGEYLLLLNPDSVCHEDVFHLLATFMDANRAVGAVGARLLYDDGTVQPSARRFPDLTTAFGGRTTWLTRLLPQNPLTRRNLLTGDHVTVPTEVDWVIGACLMVRRAEFDAIGRMDERFFLYWEDADLCRRLRQRGLSTVYHPGVSVTHLYGRSSRQAADRSLVAFHRSAFRYYRKHGGRLAALAAPLVWAGLEARLALKRLALRFRAE